jgi:magnesium transporter
MPDSIAHTSELDRREISRWINHRELRRVREHLVHREPQELADYIKDLESEEAIVVFRVLPRELAAEIFEHIPVEHQTTLLNSLGEPRVRILLNEMAADERTALFEELPASATRKLLNLLSPKERTIALTLLGYPESSVGRLMTPEYITVIAEWEITEVLKHIREEGPKSETFDVLYVLSKQKKLIGQVKLRHVLIAPLETQVKDIATEAVLSLTASEDQEAAVHLFTKYGLSTLPVVDSQNYMVGVVTVDDVLVIAAEEATEDIQKFGGTLALETPYLAAPFSQLIRSRASWLVVLLLGEMLTATTMSYYEGQLQKAVVLALFLPLIISSGGNSGSQAATLVIRSISIGELHMKDWWLVLRREIAAGLLLGILLGAVGLLRVALWGHFFASYGPAWGPLSFTVAFSLLFVVLWGTVTGAMFPLALKKLGADPATASAPMVATVVDVVGLIIYFTIASMLL